MTELPEGYIEVSDRALRRIGLDEWSQMNWFVKLADAVDFMTMSEGERLLWKEEFAAMLALANQPLIEMPKNPKVYPGASMLKQNEPLPPLMPGFTPAQMQRLKGATALHLAGLADGYGTSFEGFCVNYSVKVSRNRAYAKNPAAPRYLIYRAESGGKLEDRLMLRLSRLLETYAGMIRRCPHCREAIFLQLRRSARYCSSKCYTVAGMRRIRAERKAQMEKQLHQERKKPGAKPQEKVKT